jgi:hypothetical protein
MPASAISPLRRLFANALATALASALLPCAAVAGDQWPSRPLHLIVGFPAGSSPDLTARALAEPLEKRLGSPSSSRTRWEQAATLQASRWPVRAMAIPSA